jgi:hypothetical protein
MFVDVIMLVWCAMAWGPREAGGAEAEPECF